MTNKRIISQYADNFIFFKTIIRKSFFPIMSETQIWFCQKLNVRPMKSSWCEEQKPHKNLKKNLKKKTNKNDKKRWKKTIRQKIPEVQLYTIWHFWVDGAEENEF